MRIEQGYIFRPENPNEVKDSVRLEISDSKIEFEYSDDSSDINDYCTIGVILGVFNRIGNVTFLDCNLSGNSFGSGANLRRYSADLMLEGVHITNWQELKFSKCVVNIPSLYEWVGISVMKNRLWTEKKIYSEIPDDILLATFEKYQLLFSFGYHSSISRNEIHLKEYTNFKVVALQDDLHLSEFLEIITHFKKFLLLIANKSHISDSITLYNNKYTYGNDQGLIPMELVTNSKSKNKIQQSISAVRIEYKELQNNFEEIIKTWFENTNLYSSIDLVIEKFLNPNLSRENDFLNSCFAIETYHRRFRKVEVLKKSEFNRVRKSIIEIIDDEEYKKFFCEKLSYANEPSFRNRLFDLKEHFENILPQSVDVDNYIIKVVKTRNFLVHRGENKNTFDDFDMFYAARYIESIVRICILIELKVSETVILKTVKTCKRHLDDMYQVNKNMKTSLPSKCLM